MLAALVLSVLTRGLDVTILNVARPTIATGLSAGTGALQWMINAYVLTFAGLLLSFGALDARYGRKRLMLVGLALVGIAAVVAAAGSSAVVVIAARALMGVAAAIITPIALALLTVLFTPQERGKAIALVVMGMGVGVPLGPVIGGYLLQHVGGHGTLGTGLRLLPLIGGLIVGAPIGEWLIARTGYRLPIASGLVLLAAGLAVGATTDATTGYSFTAFWFTLAGLGIGLALAPTTDAALGELPPERAGGTAITLAVRQTGGALGVAAAGSLLSGLYAARVDVFALPAPNADAARESVVAAAMPGRVASRRFSTGPVPS